jgi:hypothetical protein
MNVDGLQLRSSTDTDADLADGRAGSLQHRMRTKVQGSLEKEDRRFEGTKMRQI